MIKTNLFDNIGATASTLCIIHCFASTALFFLIPASWATIFLGERVHQILAVILLLAGLFAFIPGYLIHKKKKVLSLGILGMGLIFLAFALERYGEVFEVGLTLIGGVTLIIAHIANKRCCNACIATTRKHVTLEKHRQ